MVTSASTNAGSLYGDSHFNDCCDFMGTFQGRLVSDFPPEIPITREHKAAADAFFTTPSINGFGQLSTGLAQLLAPAAEPQPVSPSIDYARINQDLARDHQYYEQAASAFDGYWGRPEQKAAVSPSRPPAAPAARMADTAADMLGSFGDSIGSPSQTVNTGRLRNYYANELMGQKTGAPDPVMAYAQRRLNPEVG